MLPANIQGPNGDDPSLIEPRPPRPLRAPSAAEAFRICLNPEPTAPPGSGLRVAVLHNLASCSPQDPAGLPPDALDELDNDRNVAAYVAALRSAGHIVYDIEGNANLARALAERPVDLCFNTCEGFIGDSREAQVPALLEMLDVPYSGGKVMCMANTLDKAATKRILQASGLPTLPFQEFCHPEQELDPRLRFPLFVKPNREGTGIGIAGDSRVQTEAELRQRVAYILDNYRETALVEEYIAGRDITVALIGNLDTRALGRPVPSLWGLPETPGGGVDWNGVHIFPLSEVDYSAYPRGTERFYSHKLKVDLADDYTYFCPAPLSPAIAAEVRRLAVETFRVTQSLDFARVDFRLTPASHPHSALLRGPHLPRTHVPGWSAALRGGWPASGAGGADENFQPYILEINALPGVTPTSDMTLAAWAEGWSYAGMINGVLDAAIARYGLSRVVSTKLEEGLRE